VNNISHLSTKLFEYLHDVLVDDGSLFAVVICDTVCEFAGGLIGGPLGGYVGDGAGGWDDTDGGEETLIRGSASAGVQMLDRHSDAFRIKPRGCVLKTVLLMRGGGNAGDEKGRRGQYLLKVF
jgi:hypothetical protein